MRSLASEFGVTQLEAIAIGGNHPIGYILRIKGLPFLLLATP